MRYDIMNTVQGGAVLSQVSPLEKAVEYIENHLHEKISLSDVSRATGYSYYHMTRLFSSILGESVGRYIHRRRLYNASEMLIYSGRRIIEIALDCGFGSPEAFSRAFKAAFGVRPVDYRRAGLDLVVHGKRELTPDDVDHIANNISRSPEFVMLPETGVAGLRGTTSLSDNRLPGLWAEFLDRHKDLFLAAGAGYGICETQRTTYTKDGDVVFAAMVGSPVRDFDKLPPSAPLEKKILRAGRYAVFTHRGTFANLFKTYQYIFGTWLPSAKEELDDREDFEVYEREIPSFGDPHNEAKIFIPVK